MEKESELYGDYDMEAIFEKEANGTISRWESNILIEWTNKYDKNWEIANKKITGYKEKIKEASNSNH